MCTWWGKLKIKVKVAVQLGSLGTCKSCLQGRHATLIWAHCLQRFWLQIAQIQQYEGPSGFNFLGIWEWEVDDPCLGPTVIYSCRLRGDWNWRYWDLTTICPVPLILLSLFGSGDRVRWLFCFLSSSPNLAPSPSFLYIITFAQWLFISWLRED